MSVNITVNGKFRARNKPSILDDPVRVKKQLEGELRKQRLLDVREESKKLARKIRNDVAAEKDRQLRNLEAIKAQELECWRQHVMDQKNNEYREALFQIGTAHNAAKVENEAMAKRQAAKAQERKQFKKKTNERLGVKPKQNIKKVLQTAGTQTPNVLLKDKKKRPQKKRKRKICPKEHTSTCHCTSAESESSDDDSQYSDVDDAELQSDSSKSETTKSVTICPCPKVIKCPCTSNSSSSSVLSSTGTDEEELEKSSSTKNKNPVLSKNPPVIVDIDVDSNDSISITAGEIKDKYAQSNRQFHHIVRNSSPEKKPSRSPQKSRVDTTTAKPRFTQVSQILNAKSTTSVSPSRSRSPPKPPPPSFAATTASTTVKSPHKSSTTGGIQITLSGNTFTVDSSKSDKGKDARDSSRSRVQSYDYNNKYTRDYAHPTEGLVHEPTFRQRNGPCAVEQAEMEKELEMRKEEERKRMCARSDERGRKALEREKARRDCAELTERLDALTQEYPQLLNPTDVRIQNHQLYISREARIEKKRNAAIEDLFLHPAIITCPVVDKQRIRIGSAPGVTSTKTDVGDFNLASPYDQISSSSDSRCSILLGYVDDQKKKIRNDLLKCADGQPNQNKQKADRLKNLLLRIEELRKALCEELEKNGSGDSMQQVINDVSDVRRERERMLNKGTPQENGRQSPLAKHLNDVEQKEAVLEQKLRELCKLQKQESSHVKTDTILDKPAETIVKKSDGKECRVQTTGNKPLEIIIKLKNEGRGRGKQKVKKSTKTPRKLSTLIDTPTHRLGVKRSASNVQKASTNTKQGAINRQNSYDSNSTSYRSLPSRIANDVDALVDQLVLGQEEDVDDATNMSVTAVDAEAKTSAQQAKSTQRPARVNPLIAHYVQRLLGMSRNSVLGLGVSSSDIETPSSSIMNASSNRVSTAANLADSQERIQRVQRFIEDNRSFISELEDTLRTQSDVSLETSIRMFEEIWQQRLCKEKQSGVEKAQKEPQTKHRKEIAPATADARARNSAVVVSQQTKSARKPDKGLTGARTRTVMSEAASNASQQQRAPLEHARAPTVAEGKQAQGQQTRQPAQNDEKTARFSTDRATTNTNAEHTTRDPQQKRDISVTTEDRRAEEQIARYEQLTENCTQRIAELTELIQKVRTEKKRLMEVTLSSVSEGRNSTEYIELADGTRRRSNASVDRNSSVSSGSSVGASVRHVLTTQPTTSIDYTPPDTLDQQAGATSAEGLSALDSTAPLEKHKPTGVSRDSGISISRPLTAQEMEPPSQASSTTHPSNHGGGRKVRPPPTMQRYSPNFAEDDVVHELSTIIEVDTPATSRVNATTISTGAAAAEASHSRHLQPQPFPTFEEYAREMNLDVTQLDANTSQRIHQEFEILIAQLCNPTGDTVPDYREFPSLSAYLRNVCAPQDGAEQSQSPETIEDLVSCLRIANLSIKAFPTRQEYLRQLATNSPSGEFLDSASLENISDGRANSNTETESESINIEEELRRRQLLQHSFRTAKTKEQIFSSTVRNGGEHARANHSRAFTSESGIEKLSSTSENGSSEFERQLFSLGMKWPATMRARTKESKAISSNNSSTSPERIIPAGGATAQRNSPRKDVTNAVLKSPQRSPDSTLRGTSPKRMETIKISATKEVQFQGSVNERSPTHSVTRATAQQQLRNSPERTEAPTNSKGAAHQKQRSISPTHDKSTKDTMMHDASRNNKSSQRSLPRSSDCEFLSDFGRPLNLRDFLTKELLKHASSSSTSSTPTDESLRSAFLQSIIETMTPRTNIGGSNVLDRQKTSTPVTHSANSNTQSSGEHSVSSAGNTPSQLFSESDGKECRVQTTGNKPLEIIIKLKNEGRGRGKQKVKKSTKTPRKLSTLIDTPTHRLGVKRSASNVQKASTNTKQGAINRQNSYDSNSTSYRSLPSRIANDVDALVDQLVLGQEEDVDDATNMSVTAVDAEAKTSAQQAKSTQRPARVNPLIAHYVQRLLGMSRNSVLGLGVSSSDIETPSSSIMNASSNRVSTAANLADSQERIQRVQRFIEDNRSFISELEDTLRTQSDVSLETSIRMFEEIWQQRLCKEKQSGVEKAQKEPQTKHRNKRKEIAPATADARARNSAVVVSQQTKSARKPDKGLTGARTRTVMSEAASNASQQQRAPLEHARAPTVAEGKQAQGQQTRQPAQNDEKTARFSTDRATTNTNAEHTTRDPQQKRDISVTTEDRRAEEQIARYEQLTENCTQRIAELTELIQKVRTEKKRLMEVTLSSVSEGRNSTEYIELADGTRRRSNASVDRSSSVSSGSSVGASVRHVLTTQPTTSIDYTPPDTLDQQAGATSAEGLSALDSTAPLEKHKPTGVSRDSGISISRPLTAQEMEPPSQASSTTHPSNHGGGRKVRPPPTMQRYSPNFAEDDVVHELSTIIEVDTPATSRVNATTISTGAAAAEASHSRHLQPQPFPTFEEYAREMNLDVTQLDANTSQRIHQEFEILIAQLCNPTGDTVPDYREFPSLSAYLRNVCAPQDGAEQSQSPETIEDLVSCLRIANLSIKAFPTRQEYLRQLATNSPSGEFLDSASLENISDGRANSNTETESESINIEEELRRRQLLQHSFRTAKTKEQIFSSTVRNGGEHARANHSRAFTSESGIEKLSSTSENGSSEFERQLFSLGMKWPATMRARTKESKAISSNNSSTSPERIIPAGGATAQRNSPRKDVNNAVLKSPQRSPDSTLRGTSPKRMETIKISATKEVQFQGSVNERSPTHSVTRATAQQQLRNSPERTKAPTNSKGAAHQKQRSISPTHDKSTKDTMMHDASRNNKSSQRSLPRSSDCEFLSDFGRPLNLRDFLTKELLKHASSSSTSSTPTDESLRSAFLQSIIETMTPRTNIGGSNVLDRQKTSTPVTHSANSNTQSSGEHSVSSAGNTPSQLFSGESCISSVRFFERSITRTYPRNASTAAGDEQTNDNNASKK